jgi:hypothetical protein
LEVSYLPKLLKVSGRGALLAVHGLFRMKTVGDDTERGFYPGMWFS